MEEDTILFIGDPHIQTTNLIEVDILLEKLVKYIESLDKPLSFIVIGGDVLDSHEKLYTLALNKAIDFISVLSKYSHVYVLVGNHDYIRNQEFLSNNHWLYAIKNFNSNVTIADKVMLHDCAGKYWFCPYVPNGRFEEALETNTTTDCNYLSACIIFAHQEFFGCKMGAFNSIDGDKWNLNNPMIISGHIHNKQMPQPNIFYPGSSLQQAFGESDKNIVALLNVNTTTNKINIKEIDLHLPRKRTEYISSDEFTKNTIEEVSKRNEKNKINHDKTKLVISGMDTDFKVIKESKEYKNLIDNGMKVVFKPKVQTNVNSLITKMKDIDDDSSDGNNPKYIKILNRLVLDDSSDKYLYSMYQKIVHNRNVKPENLITIRSKVV